MELASENKSTQMFMFGLQFTYINTYVFRHLNSEIATYENKKC